MQAIIDAVLKVMIDKFKEELEKQGHKLTGRLINSLEAEVKVTENGITGYVMAEDYGLILNTGVPANKIPFNPGSGAKSSKYIDALVRYFRLRGLSEKRAIRAAFATANKHKREGMPTKASYRFSQNGRRKGWIDYTIRQNEGFIDRQVEQAGEQYAEATLARTEFRTEKIKIAV